MTKEVAVAKPAQEGKPEAVQVKRLTRENRIPVSGPRDILTVTNKDPNYHYRWVKDLPGRIQRFLNGGYEFVNHDAEVGQRTVDTSSRLGSAVTRLDGMNTLVLMRIPLEWYNEDQESKQRELDSLEDAMKADGGNLKGMAAADRPDTSAFSIGRPKK